MSVDRVKVGTMQPWEHDLQKRSNEYLRNHKTLPQEQLSNSFFASSMISLNPSPSPTPPRILDVSAPFKEKNKGILTWLDSSWKAILDYFGWKSAAVKEMGTQQDYVKKSEAVAVKQAAKTTALNLRSSQKQPENSPSATSKQDNGFFQKIWKWVKEKWDSFLEIIGVKKPTVNATERDRSKRLRILQANSAVDSEDDFKYLDITKMDPLKAMLVVLVKQGKLTEQQAWLVQQKILLKQEDLKDLHLERMKIQADLALISKRYGLIEKVSIGVTAAQVLAGVASTASVVAGAATIATGGAAAPLFIVVGVLNAVISGGQALNTWWKGDTKDKLDKMQGEMLEKNAIRDEYQFQLKVDVKDMQFILKTLTGHADMGAMVLSAQYGK